MSFNPNTAQEPIRILFLASNPKASAFLRLDEELRSIKDQLSRARLRDHFEVIQEEALRVEDLDRHLLRHKPDIVHFSGHGKRSKGSSGGSRDLAEEGAEDDLHEAGLVLHGEPGVGQLLGRGALVGLFSALPKKVRLVVLNACHSAALSSKLCGAVECVVGMSNAVDDRSAIAFASSFYMALGEGSSVQTAFELGRLQMDLRALPDAAVPAMNVAPGTDASSLYFVSPLLSNVSSGAISGLNRPVRAPIVSLHSLPASLEERFYGRSELLEGLMEATSPGKAIALEASAGMGKSRLVLELIHRHRARFPGGIFWVQADPRLRDAQFHNILQSLDPSTPDLRVLVQRGEDLAEKIAEALQHRLGEMLWVVDGLPTPERYRQAADPGWWCPAPDAVALVITTRQKMLSRSVRSMTLPPLNTAAGLRLLNEDLPTGTVATNQARAVIAWVGGMPLALELLNRSLALGDLSPAEILTWIHGEAESAEALGELADALQDAFVSDGPLDVIEILRASLDGLQPEALRLARALAMLSSAPIPKVLLDALGPEMATRRARRNLLLRHLLAEPGPDDVGRMPQVLASFLRQERSPADEQQMCRGLLASLPAESQRLLEDRATSYTLARHARVLLERLEGTLTPVQLMLSHRLSRVFFALGMDAEAAEVSRGTLAISEALNGPNAPKTLTVLDRLGALLRSMGQAEEALAFQEKALERRQNTVGPGDPETLATMAEMVSTLRALGRNIEASQLQRFVLDVTGGVMSLGQVVDPRVENSGEHDKTVELSPISTANILAVEANRRKLARPKSARTTLNPLGATREMQIDRPTTTIDVETTMRPDMNTLAPAFDLATLQDPDAQGNLERLARSLAQAGRHGEARALFEQLLLGRYTSCGQEHPDTITTTIELAHTLRKLKAFGEAVQLLEMAVAARTRVLGDGHPDTLMAVGNLALALKADGQLDKARKIQEEALVKMRTNIGEDHPETLSLSGNLANTLWALGDLVPALALQEDTLTRRRKHFGPAHPRTLRTLNNLASMLQAQGHLTKAKAILEADLEAARRVLGDQSTLLISAQWILLCVHREEGNSEDVARLDAQLEWLSKVAQGDLPSNLRRIQRSYTRFRAESR